jgi:hypothetical protein
LIFSFNVPQICVFGAYIVVFSLQKSLIASSSLPELISPTAFYDFSLSVCSLPKSAFLPSKNSL